MQMVLIGVMEKLWLELKDASFGKVLPTTKRSGAR